MIENDVKEHGHAEAVRALHHRMHVGRRPPRSVRRQQLPRVVTPNAAELSCGHELNAVEAQRCYVLKLLGCCSKSSSFVCFGYKAADVQLVDDQLIELRSCESWGRRQRRMEYTPGGVEVALSRTWVSTKQACPFLVKAIVPARTQCNPVPISRFAWSLPCPKVLFSRQRHLPHLATFRFLQLNSKIFSMRRPHTEGTNLCRNPSRATCVG
mmetsp:Transcript_54133/g.127217  ORF Transcript_54133/g.127217 Transcript_54133/m.127217 type:complete len:211 (-) Transcript_54133:67-699(-)